MNKQQKVKCLRASVSFPVELYSELERLADEKKVSLAWVVRDAVEKYVEEHYPLFKKDNIEMRLP